ncbi:cytochrome b [Hyphomonas sp.]|uniref:cytochrome b n=1 Tax=Hyphomonas sp. TaxID=87 RepID=UPI00391BD1A1
MTDKASGNYAGVSRVNHWAGSLLFGGMLIVGFYLAYGGLERDARAPIMGLHRATGTLLLLFAVWRVAWRIRQGFPSPMDGVPAWQVTLSRITHWGLILSMLVMPLSGVFPMSLLAGRTIDLYGLVTLQPLAEIEGMRPLGRQLHQIAAFAFAGFIALHIAGALKHLMIDKDGTVQRMLTGRRAG